MSHTATHKLLAESVIRRGKLMNTRPKTQDQHNELRKLNTYINRNLSSVDWR